MSCVDLDLFIRYYLISFLRRAEREKKYPGFDEIIFNIIPLLKNGITPEAQTVLKVLQDIGQRTSDECWMLKSEKLQIGLFD